MKVWTRRKIEVCFVFKESKCLNILKDIQYLPVKYEESITEEITKAVKVWVKKIRIRNHLLT